MNDCTRSGKYSYMVALCMLVLVLAVAWSATAAAQGGGQPSGPGGSEPPQLPPAPVTPTPATPATPTPTSTPRPDSDGGLPPGPESEPEPEPTVLDAPNRIVFHAATPAQLCKVDDGLQYYFVGRDGSTLLGPWVPPFSELAAMMYPAGEAVSLYSGYNPFTGKPVNIDYLQSVHRIRVSTFYADREYDKNKPYIFHFGPEHDITYDTW
jgi:hypothetical protein